MQGAHNTEEEFEVEFEAVLWNNAYPEAHYVQTEGPVQYKQFCGHPGVQVWETK